MYELRKRTDIVRKGQDGKRIGYEPGPLISRHENLQEALKAKRDHPDGNTGLEVRDEEGNPVMGYALGPDGEMMPLKDTDVMRRYDD